MPGIAAALKASGCTTVEEGTAAKQFIADDIQDPKDLGDDAGKAGAKIDEILGKTNLSDDARAKIKKAMLAAFDAEKKAQPPTPPKPPSSTSIQSILQNVQGIADDERTKILAEFDKQGIIELADLGKDEQAADAKIDQILATVGLPKDKSDLCKKALTAQRAKETPVVAPPVGQPAPTVSTTVPAGAVDVQKTDFPTLKAEAAGTITAFKIPDIFTSNLDANHPYQSPDELKPWQWLHLARTNNLTKALDINRMMQGLEDPFAIYPAFLWELQDGAVDDISKGTAESTVSASIEEDRANSSLITNASIAGQYAMCSASVKASYAMQASNEQYSKVIVTRARWRQPRCSLVLENCLTVAPIFQHLIDVAFDKKSITPENQFDYLTQLFELFGHLVPERVVLGGLLEIMQQLVSVESQSQTSTKLNLDTSVGLKAQDLPASGQLDIGFKLDGSGAKNQATCLQNIDFTAIGGDPNPTDPKAWLPSTFTPEKWKTTTRDGVNRITQMLKQSDQDAIDGVIIAKAREAWTDDAVTKLAAADGGGFTLPLKFDANSRVVYTPQMPPILPFFPKGHRVTLKNWAASETSSADYLVAANIESRTPDATAENADGVDVNNQTVAPGDPRRAKGTYYAYCQPAPGCAADAAGANPQQANLLWTFVYTGQVIRDGANTYDEPLFWIVTDDQKWALSAFYHLGYAAFTSLVPYDYEQKLRKQSTPARWLLRPAVPPGRMQLPPNDDESSGYFRLYNPYYRGYLADYATLNSRRKYTEQIPSGMASDGMGGFRFVPGYTVDHDEAGPSYQRTMLRVPTGLGSVFGADGKPNAASEKTQQTSYMQQCWYIQDRTEAPTRQKFSQLDHTYIQQWIKAREDAMSK